MKVFNISYLGKKLKLETQIRIYPKRIFMLGIIGLIIFILWRVML